MIKGFGPAEPLFLLLRSIDRFVFSFVLSDVFFAELDFLLEVFFVLEVVGVVDVVALLHVVHFCDVDSLVHADDCFNSVLGFFEGLLTVLIERLLLLAGFVNLSCFEDSEQFFVALLDQVLG